MDTSVDSDSGSSMSSVSRTTLLSAQPTTVETYASPFAALSGGLSLGKLVNLLMMKVMFG